MNTTARLAAPGEVSREISARQATGQRRAQYLVAAHAPFIAPGNPVALSQALGRVLDDRGLRAQLQRRARATFAERFSAAALTAALRQTSAALGFEGHSTT